MNLRVGPHVPNALEIMVYLCRNAANDTIYRGVVKIPSGSGEWGLCLITLSKELHRVTMDGIVFGVDDNAIMIEMFPVSVPEYAMETANLADGIIRTDSVVLTEVTEGSEE